MKMLNISDNLKLPYSAVTATQVIYGGKGMGKRLALDTPLATLSGWTTMGNVVVGDTLFDERGQPCTVTFISEVGPGDAYRVVFSDDSSLIADADHLWITETARDRKRRGSGAVRTTVEIADTLHVFQGSQRVSNHSIPTAAPLGLPDVPLPLDPYVLGAWLGNGSSAAPVFTIGHEDEETIDRIRAAGFACRAVRQQSGKAPMFYAKGMKGILAGMGLLQNKHVPAAYLRASAEQRLALVQGLMDTDGGWNLSTAEYSSVRECLSVSLCELLVSLGMKATMTPRDAKLNGNVVGTDYRVRFIPTMPVFRLRRKLARCNFASAQQSRRRRRYVTAVDRVDSVPMRCISVDSPSSLYVAGRAMIPTHNTNYGAVLIEEMAKAGLRWALLDPMGVAYGLRHSADGKGPGVECLILGGAHGDIPIEPTGGAVIADLVADHTVSVILDISRKANGEMWSIGERIRFATDYGKQLFRRQGSLVEGRRREPICQIIDEAARFIPQMVRSGDVDAAKCVGTWSAIVEEGRNIGLGVVLLTQRSARLNKDVAELADLMLAFRTVGPNSIEAVIDWLGAHIAKDRAKAMVETVRSLPVGSALAVSPGWLQVEKVIAIRRRETFDSSATPKPGEQAVRVRGDGARPDRQVYAARMAETIERAKADDPKELRRQIAELQKAAKVAATPVAVTQAGMTEDERKAVAMLTEKLEALAGETEQLETRVRTMSGALVAARSLAEQMVAALAEVDLVPEDADRVRDVRERIAETRAGMPVVPAKQLSAPSANPRPVRLPIAASSGPGEKMGKALRSVLTALAQHGASSKAKIAALTGYAVNGGGFGNALGEGRTRGWLSGGDPVDITQAGIEALGPVTPLPSGPELLAEWMQKLGKAERAVLDAAASARGPLTKAEIAAQCGYAVDGGGFGNALGRLRTLGLIEGSNPIALTRDFAEAIA